MFIAHTREQMPSLDSCSVGPAVLGSALESKEMLNKFHLQISAGRLASL